MYKLLIVDDEPAELRFLEWVVKSYNLPFTICGQGTNGEEAVRLAAKHAPDLIIMDINMPIMGGLEASRIIREKQPATVIYILTAHEHFQYAQAAIKVGVEDYLLKPLKPEVLAETLKKGLGKLLRIRLANIRQAYMKTLATRYKEEQANKLLADYVDAEASLQLDVLPPNRALSLSRVQWIMGGCLWREGHSVRETYLAESCLRPLRELPVVEHATVVSGNRVAVLGKGQLAHALPLLYRWAEEWQKSSGISLAAEVANVGNNRVEATLRKALWAAAIAQFWEEAGIGEKPDQPRTASPDIELLGRQFSEALFGQSGDEALAVLDEALADWRVRCSPREEVHHLLAGFITLVTHDFGELAPGHAWGELRKQVNKDIGRSETVGQVRDHLRSFVAALSNGLANGGESLAKRSVFQAMQYINQNYNLDINLELMAKKFYLSPSYFSRMFKKHTGQGFASYLNDLRMQKARSMLVTGQFTVTEVAKRVGLEDASYFSTVFKKYHKMAPSQVLADHTGQ